MSGIKTAGVLGYQYEKPKCEHCTSTELTHQGTIYVNGSPQSMYTCQYGHYTKGLTSSQQSLVANNTQNGISATWISNAGTGGTLNGFGLAAGLVPQYQVPLNTYNLEQKVQQLQDNCQYQTNEIRMLNQKFDRVATALETLIAKIDEAKLADPLSALANRIKTFELK